MNASSIILGPPADPAGMARTRSARLLGAFGRVLSPLLLLIGLAALWGHDAQLSRLEPAEPSLPPQARQRINTRGGIVASLAFHPDGRRLVWADTLMDRIGTYDQEQGGFQLGTAFEGGGPRHWIKQLALAPDGRTVAATTLFGGVMVWGSELRESSLRLSPDSWKARGVAFTPDGLQLVAGGMDGTVRTWDTSTWSEQAAWQAQDEPIACIDIAPDRRTLVLGSYTGRLRCWELGGDRRLAEWEGHEFPVIAIDHSPDGRVLASAGFDGRVRLWDARTGRKEREFATSNRSIVDCVAYAPDGSVLASGHADHTVRLWDAATGRPVGRLEGHRGAVRSLAFSPDGRTLASGACDGAILLWDLAVARPRTAPSPRESPTLPALHAPSNPAHVPRG